MCVVRNEEAKFLSNSYHLLLSLSLSLCCCTLYTLVFNAMQTFARTLLHPSRCRGYFAAMDYVIEGKIESLILIFRSLSGCIRVCICTYVFTARGALGMTFITSTVAVVVVVVVA